MVNDSLLLICEDKLDSHPNELLKVLSEKLNLDVHSQEFAAKLDECNLWPNYRDRFFYPKIKDLPKVDLRIVDNPNDDCIYFCGNSLGLQPKGSREKIDKEMDKWANIGVYGHFEGDLPWASCEDKCRPLMAKVVGASTDEVNVMNFLSVNLHLLMVTFYQPTESRFKILLEDKAFPSDHYIIESQIRLHNLDPKECMICLKPREGESTIHTEDILKVLEEQGSQIAVVFFSGVQYYTGQLFQIKEITEAAHKQGCYAGWDLAHAVGNVELKLHEWNVDFAAWCTYKYLNSGAGSIGAIFLHEKHFDLSNKKKLDGWWSHRSETRFNMTNNIEYATGAAAYALSNASMLLTSCLLGSLEIFEEVGIKKLREKSKLLTAYLELLITEKYSKNINGNINDVYFQSLTPKDPNQRGAQLSILFSINVEKVHEELEKRGVVCDYRKPNVLRFAPVPLYNTFTDIRKFINILDKVIKENLYN